MRRQLGSNIDPFVAVTRLSGRETVSGAKNRAPAATAGPTGQVSEPRIWPSTPLGGENDGWDWRTNPPKLLVMQ
jgi:hypothetical protein